jgi:glycerol-3-phosphate O-acyltransferase/dihydroxyacetone phosphate acyltransferase
MLAFVTRVFFRDLEVIGAPGKDTHGRLFVANHWNGIVDPLVILTTASFGASPVAKSTLFSMFGMKQLLAIAEAVPVVRRRDAPDKSGADNDAVFDKIAAHLRGGGNVLIFPEGTSHSEPGVLPLKSGAARMLARARELGAKDLSLQAVALDFDDKARFRSRAVVTYGPVRDVGAIAERVGGEALVKTLVEQSATDLAALVVSGRSHGELQLIRAAAEILAHEVSDRDEHTLAAQVDLAREIIARSRALGPDDPTYQKVADAVGNYEEARRAVGLSEEQVARGDERVGLGRMLRGLGLLIIAPLAIVGALLYFVPYKLPKLGERVAKGEQDVVSTYKLGIGLVVFPLWTIGLLVLGWIFAPDPHGRWLHTALILLSPWAALRWADRLDDHRGLRLIKTASSGGVRELARLRLLRGRAVDALLAARPPQEAGGGDAERH